MLNTARTVDSQIHTGRKQILSFLRTRQANDKPVVELQFEDHSVKGEVVRINSEVFVTLAATIKIFNNGVRENQGVVYIFVDDILAARAS